jgi:DNA-3-methyladenine glycosylase I
MADVTTGIDGIARCAWAGQEEIYTRYHDEEWGQPMHGDLRLFEKMTLEGFQAGLSWITILRKRENFRAAFDGFDPERIARYDEQDVERLLGDAGIVRNRAKILAAIGNARVLIEMAPGDFDELMWSFAPETHVPPESFADVPAQTPQSTAMSKELLRRGFRFVGPTTMYALMQSAGMVDDHVRGCHCATALAATARA